MWNRPHHSLSSAGMTLIFFSFVAVPITADAQEIPNSSSRPHVLVLAVNGAETPGARLDNVNTVAGEDWLSVTTILSRVTLPEF